MALKRLEWDPKWEVSDESPDIRGWQIKNAAGTVVGKIKDLLFEPADNRVYYAVADMNGRDVQVPIGEVDVDNSSRFVTLRGYDETRINSLSAYDERQTYDTPDVGVRGEKLPRTIQLLEERLRVGKRSEQVGEVIASKRAVTETVEQDVTLVREEIDIQRRAVNEPARPGDRIGTDTEQIKVALFAEEPIVEKKAFVTEEVTLGKHEESRTETVRDEVRREELTFAGTEPTSEDIRQRELREGRHVEDRVIEEDVDIVPDDTLRRDGLL